MGKQATQVEDNVLDDSGLKNSLVNGKFKMLAGLLVLVLVAAACSSSNSEGADDSAGPDATATQSAEPEETTPETTVPETLTGLELVLDGDPPSTTISTDDIEQTAADIVHWRTQTFFGCLEDLEGCDLTDFDQTAIRSANEGVRARFQGYNNDAISIAPDARPPEQRIVWSRRSDTNENAVLVLACERNYYVNVDADGNIIDDSSPVALVLNLVERNNDDRFLITSRTAIDEYQPEIEGGDECSTFTGDEVPQDTADALLGQ